MKVFMFIAIVMIVACLVSISDKLSEIIAHQRVIESMLDDIKKK